MLIFPIGRRVFKGQTGHSEGGVRRMENRSRKARYLRAEIIGQNTDTCRYVLYQQGKEAQDDAIIFPVFPNLAL